MIDEAESEALDRHLGHQAALVTSHIALVEVPRAARLANPSSEVQEATQRLLAGCLLVDIGDRILGEARRLASRAIRTLDAIHLATALYVDADQLVAYDHRLLEAATRQGLEVASPGRS